MPSKKPSRTEQIIRLAQASPGIKTSDAAGILGMSTANLGTYTSKLRKEGVLKKTRGTLELADGANLDAAASPEAAPPAERGASPQTSTGSGKKTKHKETKKASKAERPEPQVTEQEAQLLEALINEGVRRAESYRQEGVLTNIVLASRPDGSIGVRGAMGGPALVCTMLGHYEPDTMDDPGFQQVMADNMAGMGVGDGRVTVIYNLTDFDSKDGREALVCGWVGGQRILCAVAMLEDGPINRPDAWNDLSDDLVAIIYMEQKEKHRKAISEGDQDALSGVMMSQLGDPDPDKAASIMVDVMSDEERAPVLVFSMDQGEAPSGAEPDGEPDPVFSLMVNACEFADQQRQEGTASNFVDIMRSDGRIQRGDLGEGVQIPLMTGRLPEPMSDFVKSVSDGQGVAAAFVNMTEITGHEEMQMVMVTVWDGDELGLAIGAPLDSESLKADSDAWEKIGEENLKRLGDQWVEAKRDESSQDEPEAGQVTVTVGESEPLPDSVEQMHQSFRDMDLKNQLLQMALREPGMKTGRAANFLGLPKKQVKEQVEEMVAAGQLEKTRGTLEPTGKALAEHQEMGKASEALAGEIAQALGAELGIEGLEVEISHGAPTVREPKAQPESEAEISAEMKKLVELACELAGRMVADDKVGSAVVVGLKDGDFKLVNMGDMHAMAMFGGLGDRTGQEIASMGDGQGVRAVFMDMNVSGEDGQLMVVMAYWEGSESMGGRTALVNDPKESLDYDSEVWVGITREEFQRMIQETDQELGGDGSGDASADIQVSKEQKARLNGLLEEALDRAEHYRQEGVLTNIVITGQSDGSTLVQGAAGGGAMTAVMVGHPYSQQLRQSGMDDRPAHAQMIAAIGYDQAEMAVMVNLVDIATEDEDQYALLAGWVGGERVVCSQAPIADKPLTDPSVWKPISAQQTLELYELGSDLSKTDEVQVLRETRPATGTRGLEALPAIMNDPERAPLISWIMEGDGERDSTTLRRMDPEVGKQMAAKAVGLE